jgi:hypothetical protein
MRSDSVAGDGPAYERMAGGRPAASGWLTALAVAHGVWRFFQALGTELGRIPAYQDEAERIREGLRRRHSNSRGRDGPDLPDA